MMAKVRRRAAISMIIMLIGFMAIVLVVVYRLVLSGGDAAEQFQAASIALPAGAQVISAQAEGGLITVTYAAGDEQAIRIFNGETGEMVREIAIVVE